MHLLVLIDKYVMLSGVTADDRVQRKPTLLQIPASPCTHCVPWAATTFPVPLFAHLSCVGLSIRVNMYKVLRTVPAQFTEILCK